MLEKLSKLDSQVIRALLVAVASLIGLILSFFGVDERIFNEQAGRVIDAILLIIATGGVLWAGYARTYLPTPPISDKAVARTEARMAEKSGDQGGWATVPALGWLASIMVGVMLMGASCQRIEDANPVQAGCQSFSAQTAAVCGYATYGTFVVFQRLSVAVATDVGPGRVRDALIAAEAAAKGPADSLLAAVVAYEEVRADLAQGEGSAERMALAIANLERWLETAKPLIDNLVLVYNEAKE